MAIGRTYRRVSAHVSVAVTQGANAGITCLDTSSLEASTVNSSPLHSSPRSSNADTNLDVDGKEY
jgi:hypothetical protein